MGHLWAVVLRLLMQLTEPGTPLKPLPAKRNLNVTMRGIKKAVQSMGGRLGLITDQPPRTTGFEHGSTWYDRAYEDVEEYHRPYAQSRYYFLWTVIADRVRRSSFRRVLEIGCGPGQLAAFLLDQGVEQYAGLDFSPVAVEMARTNVPGARFVVDDARTSSIYTEFEYDVIICTEVLEHIQDDLLVLSRFPAGTRCLCTVPNFQYESHVRHFRNTSEVAARYAPFFGDFDVAGFKGPQSAAQMYFLFDGVRKDSRA